MGALFAIAGGLELAVWTQDPKKEVGNFGDPLGLSNIFGYDEDMRAKELNNGRFAMFAAIGILAAELLAGSRPALAIFDFVSGISSPTQGGGSFSLWALP